MKKKNEALNAAQKILEDRGIKDARVVMMLTSISTKKIVLSYIFSESNKMRLFFTNTEESKIIARALSWMQVQKNRKNNKN